MLAHKISDRSPFCVSLTAFWAKDIVLALTPVLRGEYLDSAAMGFRAQSGTLHLAQWLRHFISLQHWRGQSLISFEFEKWIPRYLGRMS